MAARHLIYTFEIALSALILLALFWVAFFVEPAVEVPEIQRSAIEARDDFYGIAAPRRNGRVIWAVGRYGKVIRSGDAGDSWAIQNTPVEQHLQAIAAWDETHALIAGDGGTVLVTEDGGKQWAQIAVETRPMGGDQLLRARVDEQGRGWITGAMGTVLVSTDGGQSWRHTHPEEDIGFNDLALAPDGTLWLAGEFGVLRRSRDDGESWEEVPAPTDSSLMAIAFADARHGVAVGLSGTVLTTDDGGESWHAGEALAAGHFFDIAWHDGGYLAVGDGGVVARAGREGREWEVAQIAAGNFAWYTSVAPAGAGHYIGGDELGALGADGWRAFSAAVAGKGDKNNG
ncbi:WD40/YVTN/BNR-like repeat-containing protein [Arhodomonas sp. SL1]|uniref:WD40/YVTN/BNR-like repeat-containing protein n=1 Tax=Arhodomonas sp. SL1 TaxID=3425691 RepID=UPI003F8843E6